MIQIRICFGSRLSNVDIFLLCCQPDSFFVSDILHPLDDNKTYVQWFDQDPSPNLLPDLNYSFNSIYLFSTYAERNETE